MTKTDFLAKVSLPKGARSVIEGCKSITVPTSRAELIELSMGGSKNKKSPDIFSVKFDVNGKEITEATLIRCKNGITINSSEEYMTRRDPASLVIADGKPTDSSTFEKLYNKPFEPIRLETFEWLKKQDLVVMPFKAGREEYSYPALIIVPKNTAFFALALADLQTFVCFDNIKDTFTPQAVVYLAPPFRHTHFNGKQRVIHNRPREEKKPEHVYELFSYNLYPGPSAKKGIYGFMLDVGEHEGWTIAHASAVKIITPYENEIVIMHEGASGGGKSEISEPTHRETDGKILVATNIITGKKFIINLGENCELQPISDDMAIAPPNIQNNSQKLVITDGENGWFLRVDHIQHYGTSPSVEKLTINPPEPLVFMNIEGAPNSTCLIWEHVKFNGKPCANPRVILPRRVIDKVIDTPTEVDVRSFGVRTPPSTKEHPNYGIIGMMHVLPPAIAWLWRLVAPRGYANPSVTDNSGAMMTEGVGSLGPFLPGSCVTQANLFLEQILNTPATRYVLIPNQHIGVFKVGFMPQWISREYIARRGSAKFKPSNLIPARCTILGYELESMKVDGQNMWQGLLHPELQQEMGKEGYDNGAKILVDFFKKELKKFDTKDLHPIGKNIIDLCMQDAPLEKYLDIIPMKY